jgi:hypothetical protein
MHCTRRHLVALALSLTVLAGCSESLSGPAPEVPRAAALQADVSAKGHRHKDHTLKARNADSREFYLDDAALVLYDNAGNERALTASSYASMARDFDRIARADAQYERLETDVGFQSCLKQAKAKGFTVRLTRRGAATSSAPGSTSGVRFAPAGPTHDILDGTTDISNPTYCQEAALGLYYATQDYWNARNAYFWAVGLSFASGGTIQDGSLTYDPNGPAALVGAAGVEYAAANYASALVTAGIWGTFFNLGSCGSPDAQYGYTDVTVATGGGTATTLTCIVEDVSIDVSYDNGASWVTYWSGSSTVCE